VVEKVWENTQNFKKKKDEHTENSRTTSNGKRKTNAGKSGKKAAKTGSDCQKRTTREKSHRVPRIRGGIGCNSPSRKLNNG